MLVLTRRIGERLRIGPDVEVVVLEVRGREVRLGLSAPASVVIHREEIYRRIEQANRESVLAAPGLPEAMVRAARALRQREASVAAPAPDR
jgi:carbon storage regulator